MTLLRAGMVYVQPKGGEINIDGPTCFPLHSADALVSCFIFMLGVKWSVEKTKLFAGYECGVPDGLQLATFFL